MSRLEIFEYVKESYGTIPDFPWMSDPESAVLRHGDTRKWYGLLMRVSGDKIGLPGTEPVEILNVKCDPEMISALRQSAGFFPAYHMNKEQWMTILLDGTVPLSKVLDYLAWSYELTKGVKKKKMEKEGKL